MADQSHFGVLGDITNKVRNEKEKEKEPDVQEELSWKTLEKIRKMTMKNMELKRSLEEQIESFKLASKNLVDSPSGKNLEGNKMGCKDFERKKNKKSEGLIWKLSELLALQQEITIINQKFIDSQQVVFETESENSKLKWRLSALESAIFFSSNSDSSKCTCSLF